MKGAELLQRAEKLTPDLAARSGDTAARRSLLPENLAALEEAGFFRCLLPVRWGGFETDPEDFFTIVQTIGAACPSTGWVLSVVGVHNWQLALFPLEAQQEVREGTGKNLIASSYMPVGKVKAAPGGFRLSGTWGFSSGIDHCGWVFLGAMVPAEGGRRDLRTFLVPRGDITIVDDWQVTGLEGTGSKTVVVEDRFVPEHRTHRFRDGFMQDSPGNEINPGLLYRIPFGQMFIRAVTSGGLGMLAGALDAFLDVQRSRVARSLGQAVATKPPVQLAAARAALTLRQLRLGLREQFTRMRAELQAGRPLSMDDRVLWRYEAATVTPRCTAAVDELFKASGGSALFHTNPISRYFNDIHAAGAHYANNPWDPGCNLGRTLLGQDNEDHFI